MISALALVATLQQKHTYDPSTLVPKSEVMVVGVFHFDTPGLDRFNPEVKGIMEERRQGEIKKLVSSLAEYKPTKVCIENTHTSPAFQQRLDKYLAGDYELTATERDQIGLRLSKMLGHKNIYSVDVRADMDFGPTMELAAKSGKQSYVDGIMTEVGTYLQSLFAPEIADKLTMSEIIAQMNTPEADVVSQSVYLRLMMVGEGEEFPGADMLGVWYTRNLKIATNLFRLVEKPGERILLVIGAGHAKIIRDTVRDMPNVKSVSPLPYLKKN